MTDERLSTLPADHLHVLALRSMHGEMMLQPRHASLFESEPLGLIEEASEYFTGQLLRDVPAPVRPTLPNTETPILLGPESQAREPDSATGIATERDAAELARDPRAPMLNRSTPVAAEAALQPRPHIASAAALPALPGRPPLVAAPLDRDKSVRRHGRPPVALSPETQLHDASPEQRVFRLTATPASEPVRTADAHSAGRDSRRAVFARQRSAEPTSVLTRTGEPTHLTASMNGRREAEVRASATEAKYVPGSSNGRTSLAETTPHGMMVARVAPDMRNITPLFVPASSRDRDEQSVEITIGRLEIRAAAPTPPVPRAARPQPQRTLKEYLSRNAGRSQ